jgi:hypothetical protein
LYYFRLNNILEIITKTYGNIPKPCQGIDPSLPLSAYFSSSTENISNTASHDITTCLLFITKNMLDGLSINTYGIINPDYLLYMYWGPPSRILQNANDTKNIYTIAHIIDDSLV